MASRACGRSARRSCAYGLSRIDAGPAGGNARHAPQSAMSDHSLGGNMKFKLLGLATALAAGALSAAALAQAGKEQFFPALVYRTGPYAPNGVPFANGYVDYLKLVNAQGGINGVKITFEECETGYATDKGVECYERLKGKGATVFQPLSTGITFALTEKAPADKIPLITAGYGRSESADGQVFKWNFPLMGTYWVAADVLVQHIGMKEGGQ